MSKKKRILPGGLVYSTDPSIQIGAKPETEPQTLPPSQQKLQVRLETRRRAGKVVTQVTGFVGSAADLAALGRQLKEHCGTGGSAKDGAILIQGDQCDRIMQWLTRSGYVKSRQA